MSDDLVMRKYIVSTSTLHRLMDIMISDCPSSPDPVLARGAFRTLSRLMHIRRSEVYIPGQTLDCERQRVRIMQHGWILAALRVSMGDKDSTLTRAAEEHLVHAGYQARELDWNLRAVDRFMGGEDSFLARVKSHKLPGLAVAVKDSGDDGLIKTSTDGIPLMIYTQANFNFNNSEGENMQPRQSLRQRLLPGFGQRQLFSATQHLDLLQGKELLLSE